MFDSESLMPHAVCWAAAPGLIWTMVITNAITFLSYSTLCATLIYLVLKTRRVMVREWAYFGVGFAAFIMACGSTHLLEVITTWSPVFWVDAGTNVLTAGLSAYVAMMLIGRVTSIAYSVNDYADKLANVENEKQEMEASLLASEKLEDWSRMSAAVSHEIKNPLQAIQNLQYLIKTSEGVSPLVLQLASMAEEEAKRVLAISEATLSVIRQAVLPEMIDLQSVAESSRFVLSPLILSKGVTVVIRCDGDCTVEAHAGETRQALLNVLRNACEATMEMGKHVRVELIGQNNSVEVIVTDEGMGMEPEVLSSIFQFGMTTKGKQGNGMGLWTVKQILNKHKGEVKVESRHGEGTKIRLVWPRVFAAQAGRMETALQAAG